MCIYSVDHFEHSIPIPIPSKETPSTQPSPSSQPLLLLEHCVAETRSLNLCYYGCTDCSILLCPEHERSTAATACSSLSCRAFVLPQFMANGATWRQASWICSLTVAVKVFSESMGILCVSNCGNVYLTHWYQRRNNGYRSCIPAHCNNCEVFIWMVYCAVSTCGHAYLWDLWVSMWVHSCAVMMHCLETWFHLVLLDFSRSFFGLCDKPWQWKSGMGLCNESLFIWNKI